MAAATLMAPGGSNGQGPTRLRRGGKRSPFTFGRILAAIGVGAALVVVWSFSTHQTVTERPNEMKTTQVVLPPPPPPPPPPEPVQVEQPPEPTVAPPIEQPVDAPPPPDQQPSSEQPAGDSALTAREGAGPNNYGLAVGDGGGTRIGGRPGGGGGDGFAAYANVALAGIRQAAQADRDLSRGRYSVQLAVTVGPDGRITNVRVLSGGDDRRNARLREVLTGLQLSQRPPAGLPVMRVELNARSGA